MSNLLAERENPLRRSSVLAFAAGVVLICCAFLILGLDGDAVDSLVEEDGPVEWVGALGLFAGSGLFLAAFLTSRRRRGATGMERIGVWSLLGMAIVLFFFAGEEISWAQRLFGFGTPESFSGVNAQDETNLHNINAFQGTTLDGDRLFRIGWFALFVLLPVLAWLVPWVRRVRAQLLPIVVPLWLSGLFVVTWVLTDVFIRVFEDGYTALHRIGSAGTEIQEAIVELLMGLSALLTLLVARHATRAPRSSDAEPSAPAPAAAPPR